MAARIDITISDNARWPKTFLFVDADEAPIDWTGSTFEMDIRPSADAAVASAELSSGNGDITLSGDPTDGRIILNIPLGVLPVGEYVHDLLRTIGAEEPELIWRGSLKVLKGVTRDD